MQLFTKRDTKLPYTWAAVEEHFLKWQIKPPTGTNFLFTHFILMPQATNASTTISLQTHHEMSVFYTLLLEMKRESERVPADVFVFSLSLSLPDVTKSSLV